MCVAGCGVFFYLVFPGAYVRIEESMKFLPLRSQLRVYAAGACASFSSR